MKIIRRMMRIGFRKLPWNKAATKRHIDAQINAIVNHASDAWYALMSNPFEWTHKRNAYHNMEGELR